MRVLLLAFGILLVALTVTSASATVLISNDNGGLMEDYARRFRQVRQSGEPVVIDGTCMSACTMVLGLIPRDRICATPQALLGFHAAWQVNDAGHRIASAAGTRELMSTYPAAVRAWITRQGGLKPGIMLLQGSALAAIVPPCDKVAPTVPASRMERVRGTRKASASDLRQASADFR